MITHQDLENLIAKKITLSQSQIEQGAKSHNHIRELLGNKKDTDPLFPWLIDGDFLSGSYARGTKIHPLDDIDVMVVLDGTGISLIQNGQIANVAIRGSGDYGSPVNNLTNNWGYISSQKVLNSFRSALNTSYPNSKISKDGQAINVLLDSYDLGLDIVPCFHIIPRDNSKERYYIPAGGNNDFWIPTNPKIDNDICKTIDDLHGNKLKPVIRLIKYWNTTQNENRLRSYHVEVLAWLVFYTGYQNNFMIKEYPSAVQYFFRNITPYLQTICQDPTEVGEHIDRYLTPALRTLSLIKVQEAKEALALTALGLPLSIQPSLSSTWYKVFPDLKQI